MLVWAVALALASSGCPQMLSDDFSPTPMDRGTGGSVGDSAGNGGSAGSIARGGSEPGPNPGSPDASCVACEDCSWTPFRPPERVTGLGLPSANSAWGPALSTDALTLIFSSGEPEDLFVATRTGRGASFSAATPIPGALNSAASEGTAFLGFDGLRLYLFNNSGGDRDIYVSARPSLQVPFEPPDPVGGVNSPASDHLPWVSADELRMYFSSSRGGGAGGYDLWVATRTTRDGSFRAPRALVELNTADDDEGASLMRDELTLFFASDRSSSFDDIWMTTRTAIGDAFGAPVRVAELSSDSSELNVAVSADGRELFFSTDRAGASHELWRATRNCE